MSISSTYDTNVRDVVEKTNAKLIIKSMLTTQRVQFPAFLTSFSQSWTSSWNEEEVYGRMDPIATFQSTRRIISVAFDLPATNVSNARDNLKNCDKLAKFLYPGYTKQTYKSLKDEEKLAGRIIARPPLVSVKFANLIGGFTKAKKADRGGQLGYLSGLDWTPVLEMGMYTGAGGKLFPKVISLSFTLNVLHQADKGFSEGNKWLSNGFFGT